MLRVIAAVLPSFAKPAGQRESNTRCGWTNLPERAGQQARKCFHVWLTPASAYHKPTNAYFRTVYRVDVARSREVGGTGLGLAMAKHLMEVHGGRLWVESEVGQGSTSIFCSIFDPERSAFSVLAMQRDVVRTNNGNR